MKPKYYGHFTICDFLPSFDISINYCFDTRFIEHMSKIPKEIKDKRETKYNAFWTI